MWLTHRGNFDFGCFVHSPHFFWGIRGITRLYFSSENPNPGVCVCWGVDYTATHLQICVMCQSPNSPLQSFWILSFLGQPSGLVIFKPSMKSSAEMLLWKLCSQAPKQIYGKVIYSERDDLLRLEICRDRRSCKIFPSCVKFWGNNANLLGNYRVIYALNE